MLSRDLIICSDTRRDYEPPAKQAQVEALQILLDVNIMPAPGEDHDDCRLKERGGVGRFQG